VADLTPWLNLTSCLPLALGPSEDAASIILALEICEHGILDDLLQGLQLRFGGRGAERLELREVPAPAMRDGVLATGYITLRIDTIVLASG
jgi:hypothetical protein